jgi:hypothetical protein
MAQIRTPESKRAATGVSTPVSTYDSSLNTSRIGHHNDCFLASSDDQGTYENKQDQQWTYDDTVFTVWGGETCALNSPRSDCPSALHEMSSLHSTYLNDGYNPTVLKSWKNQGCYDEIHSRFGYRISLSSASLSVSGSTLSGSLSFVNYGFAAPFNPYEMYLILSDSTRTSTFLVAKSGTITTRTSPTTDLRTWIPNPNHTPIVLPISISLPSTLFTGTSYRVYLHFSDPLLSSRAEYSIRLANVQTSVAFDKTTGWNQLMGYSIYVPKV